MIEELDKDIIKYHIQDAILDMVINACKCNVDNENVYWLIWDVVLATIRDVVRIIFYNEVRKELR